MSFSEKPDDEFSQQEQERSQDKDEDITNVEENQGNSIDYNDNNNYDNNNYGNNNNQNTVVKKNRTLQYYKFLFYTMKTEIKVHDLLKLLRNSNTAELSIWTMSVVLFANIPKNFPILKEGENSTATYSGVFIWFHIFHIIRAFLGMYIGYKLPRSYQIMDILQNISDEKLAKTLFNDIIRETLLNNAIIVIKQRKVLIFIYFISTILNAIIDIIDFFIILSKISGSASSAKVVFITYMIITVIYLVIDFAYFFWAGQLRYIFPPEYLRPITDLKYGIIDRAMMTFKLGKNKTNVISEAKVQQNKGPYAKGSNIMNNGGINILEYVMKDSLGIYNSHDNDKYLPENNNQSSNNGNIKYDIQNNIPNSNEILN